MRGPQSRVSNLRNGNVAYVPVAYFPQCRRLNLRKGGVALSILGVKGHPFGPHFTISISTDKQPRLW